MINGIKLVECAPILQSESKDKKDDAEDEKDEVKDGKKTVGKVPTGGVGYNFWDLIGKLHWKGIQDGKNHTRPSWVWTREQYDRLVRDVKSMAESLIEVLDESKIWDNHIEYQDEDKKKMFVYHLVGLGKIVYEAILADTQFSVAFMGDEQDFLDFLSRF